MLLITNEDVAAVLDMAGTVDALRVGYADLRSGMATYGPRIDHYLPTGRPDDYHQWGSMVGSSASFGVLAVRMKSDVVSWPANRTQEKHCVEPGRYCGLILLFAAADGAPLAIMHDGYLQHLRVGGAAAIGTDLLARGDAKVAGCLGSGGMARSMLEGLALVRRLEHVRVFSPDPEHRRLFAEEMTERLGVEVVAVASAEEAVRPADIVLSATDSLVPTLDPAWLEPGSHVTCVTRRELSEALLARAGTVIQLGSQTVPHGVQLPMLEWRAGAIASYVAGAPEDRARIPAASAASRREHPTLLDLELGTAHGRQHDDEVTVFVPTGTQGLQFAAVGGRTLELVRRRGLGRTLPIDWFLQEIRD